MNKPMSVKINDFCNGIANLINDSELPFYITEIYLKNALEETHKAAVKQRQQELSMYNEFLKEVNEDGIAKSL